MDGHLDLLGLDAVRAGDATLEQRAHADACAECRTSIDGFRELGRRLALPQIGVPPELSRRILSQARPKRLRWAIAAAAAALVVVGLSLWLPTPRRLDIVDAYGVALRLRNGQAVEPKWDLNGDGKIDEQDVDEIARRSVAVR